MCRETIKSMRAEADQKGYKKGSAQRRGMLAFDSTMVRDGVHYDLNNDLVGLDFTQSHDVITARFRMLVSS
jgi:hypothetical protein